MNDAKQTLSNANVGDIFECMTSMCGAERSERILVTKVTRYRGETRLKVRDADGLLTGTMTVIPGRIGQPVEFGYRTWLSAAIIAKH